MMTVSVMGLGALIDVELAEEPVWLDLDPRGEHADLAEDGERGRVAGIGEADEMAGVGVPEDPVA
ncbi:hypothetical protein D3C72_2399100 [compost metagenome]